MNRTRGFSLVLSLALAVSVARGDPQAAKGKGEVWIWGADGTMLKEREKAPQRLRPVKFAELGVVVAVAGGGDGHSLALKEDGTVWSWGMNPHGELGDGTKIDRAQPAAVPGLKEVVAISAGSGFSVALKKDGTVWAWGSNIGANDGVEVESIKDDRLAPVQVAGLTDVTAVSAGHLQAMALRKDGSVWSWGGAGSGNLGNGTGDSSPKPIQAVGLRDVRAISAGGHFSLALKKDGTVWGWGSLDWDGSVQDRKNPPPPAQVPVLTDIVQISAGYQGFLALKKDGSVWGWGSWTFFGEPKIQKPQAIPSLRNATSVACGFFHALVLKKDGTVLAWGWNQWGQLGDGTTEDKHLPIEGGKGDAVPVFGLAGVQAIAAGSVHSFAIR